MTKETDMIANVSAQVADESDEGNLIQRLLEDESRIASEMVKLGFWAGDTDEKAAVDNIVNRQGELASEIRNILLDQDSADQHQAAEVLSSLRESYRENRHLIAACKKQDKREKARKQQLDWYQRKGEDILYLGEKVSSQLNQSQSDLQRLASQNLPEISNVKELAELCGLSIPELRFLAFSKKTSLLRHYRQFDVPKKTDGVRRISAPLPRLKRIQYWILDNILQRLEQHDAAHGFTAGRSIKTNADPHVGASVVINLDLKDFFPSITYPRVKGLFRGLGFSGQLASVMALICTEYDFEEVSLDGTLWYVGRGDRKLPQGSPASPAISNLICRKLDARLHGMASKLGYCYTRYADDLTFSSRQDPARNFQQLLWRCKQIVKSEGFVIHPDKTRIMRKHQQQSVTGLVVNEKLSLDRKVLKSFRALLFQIRKDGFEGKYWNGKTGAQLVEVIKGYARYVQMIDPLKGNPLMQQVGEIVKSHSTSTDSQQNGSPKSGRQVSREHFRQQAAAGNPPWDDWWQAEMTMPLNAVVNSEIEQLPEPMYRKALQLTEQQMREAGSGNASGKAAGKTSRVHSGTSKRQQKKPRRMLRLLGTLLALGVLAFAVYYFIFLH